MLEANDISISYSGRSVVRSVSISLEPGRLIALLGANGAGKTSLLKSLNGSLIPDSGEILLEGKRLAEFSRREIAQRIAVVAQETETEFPVSVLDYVLGGRFAHGAALGWESDADIKVAEDCLALCDLNGFQKRNMNKLSGGERQRAVLARAIATQARFLLLDEPTANLDLSHQAMMFRLVRERCVGCGAAAIVITHDPNLASEFADEMVLLKAGSIIAQGPPSDVLTVENIREAFGVDTVLDVNPVSGKTRVTTIF